MYFLYILKSSKRDWNYIGITANLLKRIEYHDKGLVRSTKAYRPLMLIYKEIFDDKQSARQREIFLKKTAGARKEIFSTHYAPIV